MIGQVIVSCNDEYGSSRLCPVDSCVSDFFAIRFQYLFSRTSIIERYPPATSFFLSFTPEQKLYKATDYYNKPTDYTKATNYIQATDQNTIPNYTRANTSFETHPVLYGQHISTYTTSSPETSA